MPLTWERISFCGRLMESKFQACSGILEAMAAFNQFGVTKLFVN